MVQPTTRVSLLFQCTVHGTAPSCVVVASNRSPRYSASMNGGLDLLCAGGGRGELSALLPLCPALELAPACLPLCSTEPMGSSSIALIGPPLVFEPASWLDMQASMKLIQHAVHKGHRSSGRRMYVPSLCPLASALPLVEVCEPPYAGTLLNTPVRAANKPALV